jgi:hypothetical protein
MKTFEDYENVGRSKFKKLCDKLNYPVKFTEDQYSNIDAYTTGATGIFLVEIKNRDEKYIDNDLMLIEKTKYMNILIDASNKKMKPLYIFTFNNSDIIKIADLSKIDLEFIKVEHPKSIFDQTRITKEIAYIKDFKTIKL